MGTLLVANTLLRLTCFFGWGALRTPFASRAPDCSQQVHPVKRPTRDVRIATTQRWLDLGAAIAWPTGGGI